MKEFMVYGRAACRADLPIDSCPFTELIERDWWLRGYREIVAEEEGVARRANIEAEMQNFGMALRMFSIDAAATRDAWPETQWLRRAGDSIVLIHTGGIRVPWEPTHAELLATDWRASSGVVGWTGLNLDINGQPWPRKT